MMHIGHFTFNSFQTSCYVVWDESGNCAFIDPGCSNSKEISALKEFVVSKNLKPTCIMLTHCHFDHIYGTAGLSKEYQIPVYAAEAENFTLESTNPSVCGAYGLPMPEAIQFTAVSEGETITVGSVKLEVIETPGHSKGGLCFLDRSSKVLFSGDTLFAGAIGRTDHPGGDYDQLMRSIFEKLMVLDGDVKVMPGHGPTSDIATERNTNPFLMPFNEPFED